MLVRVFILAESGYKREPTPKNAPTTMAKFFFSLDFY